MLPIEADLCENKEDSNIDPDGTEKVFTKMKDIRDCIYHIDKAQDRYKEDYDRKIRGCSKKSVEERKHKVVLWYLRQIADRSIYILCQNQRLYSSSINVTIVLLMTMIAK